METFLEEPENNVLFKGTKVENSILARNTGGKESEEKRERRENENFYVLHFPFYLICTLLSPLLRGAT